MKLAKGEITPREHAERGFPLDVWLVDPLVDEIRELGSFRSYRGDRIFGWRIFSNYWEARAYLIGKKCGG